MTEISISQALRYSGKLKKQLSDAKERAQRSISHIKGQGTAFSFQEMFDKVNSITDELATLKGKMAIANATNTIDYNGNKITLAYAIRILEEIKGKIAWLKGLPCQQLPETTSTDRVWDEDSDKSVPKTVVTICHLPEASRAELVDNLQEEFDNLNNIVESVNHVVKFVI